MTSIPARRQYARFVCRLPFQAVTSGRGSLDGAILNISMGGACVCLRAELRYQTMTLRVSFGSETLTLEARIVRLGGFDPQEKGMSRYGVEFLKDPTTQGRLRLIVDRVRVAGNNGSPASMTQYWR